MVTCSHPGRMLRIPGQDYFKIKYPTGPGKPLSYRSSTSLPPVFIPGAWLSIKQEEYLPWIMQSIEETVKQFAEITWAKFGLVAMLEDVQFSQHAAFSPVHIGKSSVKLLHKNIPEILKDKGLAPRMRIFMGCDLDPLLRNRAKASLM